MGSASRPGPVKAALAGAPKGSLDGWPRCSMISERGNGRLFAHIRRKFQRCPNRKFLLCGDRPRIILNYSEKVCRACRASVYECLRRRPDNQRLLRSRALRRTDEKPRRSVTLVEVKASRITKIAGLSLAGFVAGNKAAFG